ncbi:amidohydrolase family protein [Streptomyces sp. NBC_00986]|uniref:amidohydrolase family protein n=1 Tax=Streptomyces sp. NBC_00986 TaxID=2903702 RepID=UPI003863041F|nr:hypothetical protein OG504_47545 [Streptomyces sp. NBC_00986]
MAALRRDFTLDDLAPEAAAAGIDRTILVQVLPDADETAEFLSLAGAADLVAGVVGWADLTSDHLTDTLTALRTGTGGELLVGIRHLVQGETDRQDALCRWCTPGGNLGRGANGELAARRTATTRS